MSIIRVLFWAYFRNKRWQRREMVEQNNSLAFQSNGTAIDPNTGLVWMIPLVGQGWNNGAPGGNPAEYSWRGANSRFGRARNILSGTTNWVWSGDWDENNAYFHQYPFSQETYGGFKFGKKRFEFSGYRDWRLPTIEELWSLSKTNLKGTQFDVEDSTHMDLWTANSSTRSLLGILQALLNYGGPCAWMFRLRPDKPDGYGNRNIDERHFVRLVRGGNMFEAIY